MRMIFLPHVQFHCIPPRDSLGWRQYRRPSAWLEFPAGFSRIIRWRKAPVDYVAQHSLIGIPENCSESQYYLHKNKKRARLTPKIVTIFPQSINQWINQSINQWINQSINQSINQLINQSINKSINQSINRTNNQSDSSSQPLSATPFRLIDINAYSKPSTSGLVDSNSISSKSTGAAA